MQLLLNLGLFLIFCFSLTSQADAPIFPRGSHEVFISNGSDVRSSNLENITLLVDQAIANGHYPGAVILVGHRGHTIYRGVFGNQSIQPYIIPMRFNTIFDIASLTKVVATTPAIMQLVERGKINLDMPVAHYWPAFAGHHKETITIRQLLTHTSGLPPEISLPSHPANTLTPIHQQTLILKEIAQLKPKYSPGTTFLYSDVNFIILAYLVEIISGERFDIYVQNHIFKPLGMTETFFVPSTNLRNRIAPTEIVKGMPRWGQAQDPVARMMGGMSGNAGLFSTAKDLGIFAECLVNGGKLPAGKEKKRKGYLLGPLTILKMTTPQTPPQIEEVRGLGWDVDSSYTSRGNLLPIRSFGHTGWTGTSIWIDPITQTWIIMLTSRLHPVAMNGNPLIMDRRTIANIVAASITDISTNKINNTGKGELNRAFDVSDKK